MGVNARTRTILRTALHCAALIAGLSAGSAAHADCGGLAGQYFFDIDNPALTEALAARLGDAVARFDERYQVQVPFEATGDGYVYAPACKAHDCGSNEAFLGVDEATCDVFAALLEDAQYTLVLPDSPWPQSLYDARRAWMGR
jgi:hypothetical protein